METKASMELMVLVIAISLISLCTCEELEEGPAKEVCQGNQHVCTSLMKYPDGYVANEGPYCTCRHGNCGSAWADDDNRALTWKHYERAHWKVQYRFCTPIVDDTLPVCEGGERAAVIKTEVVTWKPFLEEARCRCRDGVHHMNGWKKEGSVWNYFYSCHKRDCPEEDSVCATIAVDRSKKTNIVKEVELHCACKAGHLCPAKIQDEDAVKTNEVIIRCKPVKQSHSKKT